jgi:hypothetical protein
LVEVLKPKVWAAIP